MQTFNVSSTVHASLLLQFELSCKNCDLVMALDSSMQCPAAIEAALRAGLACEGTWESLWRWQVAEGLAVAMDIPRGSITMVEVARPTDSSRCILWSNETVEPCTFVSPLTRAFEECNGRCVVRNESYRCANDTDNISNGTALNITCAQAVPLRSLASIGPLNSSVTWAAIPDEVAPIEVSGADEPWKVVYTAMIAHDKWANLFNSTFVRSLVSIFNTVGPAIPGLTAKRMLFHNPQLTIDIGYSLVYHISRTEAIMRSLSDKAMLLQALKEQNTTVSSIYFASASQQLYGPPRGSNSVMQIFGSATLDGLADANQFANAIVSIVDSQTGLFGDKTVSSLSFGLDAWVPGIRGYVAVPRPRAGKMSDFCPLNCYARCNNSVEVLLSDSDQLDTILPYVQTKVAQHSVFETLVETRKRQLVAHLNGTSDGTYAAIGVSDVQQTVLQPTLMRIDCMGVPGGMARLDQCGVCGGTNDCVDCSGVPGGNKRADSCGFCDENPANDCVVDCRGFWGGNISVDGCGVCGANGELCYDCAQVPFGENEVDECGVCDDANVNDCSLDCFGVWGGGAVFDQCSVCGGGHDCVDCAGIPYGNHTTDNCETCDGFVDNDCSRDCAHVWGGGLQIDGCGVCNGTNITCIGCDGVLHSGNIIDACGICGGDGACLGCDGVPNSSLTNDICGRCNGSAVPSDFFSVKAEERPIRFDIVRGPMQHMLSFQDCARSCLEVGPECKAVVGAVAPSTSFQSCYLGIVNGTENSTMSSGPGSIGFYSFPRMSDPLTPVLCAGCDGIPLSGVTIDSCGTCGGDDQCTAVAQIVIGIDVATIPPGSAARATFESS
eukprot:COSAG05_NODE_1841_length_3978_cov_45.671565_1_plen_833_part_10